MRRICCLVLIAGTAVFGLLVGCAKQSAPSPDPEPVVKGPQKAPFGKKPGEFIPSPQKKQKFDNPQLLEQPVDFTPADPIQQKFASTLFEALHLLGEKKYAEALTALETAAKIKDTDLLQAEIKKLRGRLEQIDNAERLISDIQTVLDQGKFALAARLATSALQEYGPTDAAPKLLQLKQQADALVAGGLGDNATKFKEFAGQGQAALETGNLRAAGSAFELALLYGDDAKLKDQYDSVSATLAVYDANRQKAQALRKDPASLEEAIDLLKQTAREWDTLQLRQDIDEYTFALQLRRERLSVADFQVHGDVGIPDAGQVFAEALLPYFKGPFDLVERPWLIKLLAELKLEAGKLGDNPQDQQAVGKLAKVRFLVLGSITRVGGLIAHARLVDAQSGLVMQTAKISAGTPEELMRLLPVLAKMLQMSDEQRVAYEQELAKAATAVQPVDVGQPLPPPPAPVNINDMPPAKPVVVLDNRLPPNQGGIKVADFQRFQVAPPDQPPPTLPAGDPSEDTVKKKMLYTALYLGDNAYFAGNYPLAMRHFLFALTLAPDNYDIQIRIARCQPLLPPPPVVVLQPPPPSPRLAIIDFVVVGDPNRVPPSLGWWTPQNLAPYLSPPYDIVPSGEINWWMARMDLTVNDLMTNPYARLWLGRALGARYFLLGNIVETKGIDVNTYLIDAETGYLQGRGWVHAYDAFQLRFRLGDLASSTLADPNQWQQQQQQYPNYDELIVKAHLHTAKGEFSIAIGFVQKAQAIRPGGVEVQVLLQQLDQMSRQRAWQESRQREFEKQQKQALKAKQFQDALAQEAQKQRMLAASSGAPLSLGQQQAAQQQLVVQARVAFKNSNFKLSVQTYESALRLKQNNEVDRELAEAKAKLEQVTQERLAAEAKLQAAQLQLQKQQELAQLAGKQEAQRKQREAAEAALRKAQDRDKAQAQTLIEQGKKHLAEAKYNAAVGSFQAAQRLHKDAAAAKLLESALIAQAKADAKGEAAKELERQHAEAKLKQDKYLQALQTADKALANREYAAAIANYQEAGKYFKTDAVLAGMKKAADLQKAGEAEAKRKVQFDGFVAAGKKAMDEKRYDDAVKMLSSATSLIPGDKTGQDLLKLAQLQQKMASDLAGKLKLEEQQKAAQVKQLVDQARKAIQAKDAETAAKVLKDAAKLLPMDAGLAQARLDLDTLQRTLAQAAAKANLAKVQQLVTSAEQYIKSKQLDAAAKALTEAQALAPMDANVVRAQKLLQQARTDLAGEAKKASYDQAIKQGQDLLAMKKYVEAIKAFQLAGTYLPGDATALALLKQAQKAQTDAGAAQLDAQKKADFNRLMKDGQAALAAKKYAEAVKHYSDANKLIPGDASAAAALKEANREWEANKLPTLPTPAQKAEYDKAMKAGAAWEKLKKWDDAMKAYEAALKQIPKDAKASYSLNMSTGNRYLALKQYPNAVREFEAALQLYPNDPDATMALKKAKEAK